MTAKNPACERCRQVRHVWRKCPCVCVLKCGHPACDGHEDGTLRLVSDELPVSAPWFKARYP